MENMLDCTWNDLEAQTALRRMRLKEQKEKLAVTNSKRKAPQRESSPTRQSLKRVAGENVFSGSV
jgi:hypothetical protein